MSVIDQFTRREVMELTGATSNQLQYLERVGLVKPTRHWGNKKKPDVYYTWEQLVEIRAIRNLRNATSLQVIRKVLEFFEQSQFDKRLGNKQIVVVDDQVFWVKTDWSDLGQQISALKVGDRRGNGVGQYTLLVIPAMVDLVNEIWMAAEKSNVIDIDDFGRRAKHNQNFGVA